MTMYKKIFSIVVLGFALNARAIDVPNDPQQYAAQWHQIADARTQIVKPQSKLIAYFDRSGKVVKQPDAKGYYRELLGYTANGRAVVQDFYQESKSKQSDAFVLQKGANVRDFSNRSIEHGSRIRWYNPQGQLTQTATILNGKQRGIARYHPQQGYMVVWLDITSQSKALMKMKAFTETGKPVFDMVWDNQENNTWTYFHANGQKLQRVRSMNAEGHGKTVSEYWDENGQPVEAGDQKIAGALMRVQLLMFAILTEYLPEYEDFSGL